MWKRQEHTLSVTIMYYMIIVTMLTCLLCFTAATFPGV